MYKCNFTYLIETIFSENVIFTMSYLCLKVLRIVLISVKFTNTLILGQPSWVIFLCSGYPP